MKRYSNREELREAIAMVIRGYGFQQRYIDECRIQALQERRIAASFAVAILSVAVETAEISGQDDLKKVIERVIAECQMVLEDNSIYIQDNSENPENSRLLEDASEKALEAVSHAGNLCNNLLLLFSGNMQKIILQARDRCDFTTRRMIGD